MLKVTKTIAIDEAEIELQFVRSSGPGGQNVNKVSTAVQLRFDVAGSPNLPEELKERLAALAGQRLSQDGILILTSREHRTQEQNRRAALDKLMALLKNAARRPKPRKATRPSRAAKERRVEQKQRQGEKKQQRKKVTRDDW